MTKREYIKRMKEDNPELVTDMTRSFSYFYDSESAALNGAFYFAFSEECSQYDTPLN